MQLAKSVRFAKFQPFLKTSVFSTLGATLSRENTQPENMCDIVFEKAKDHDGTVNRTNVYTETVVRMVL